MSIQDDVVRMFKQGISIEMIADATGVPKSGVIGTLMRRKLFNIGGEGLAGGVVMAEGKPVAALKENGLIDLVTEYGTVKEQERKGLGTYEGLRPRGAIKEIGPEVREAVIREYRAYLPVKLIERRLGVTRLEIWKILVDEGEPLRTYPFVSMEQARARRDEEIAHLYEMGVDKPAIRALCGVSGATIYAALKRMKTKERDQSLVNEVGRTYSPTRMQQVVDTMKRPEVQELLLLKRRIEKENPTVVIPVRVVQIAKRRTTEGEILMAKE